MIITAVLNSHTSLMIWGGDTLAVYKADIINIITQINQIEFASWKSSTKEE